MIYVACADEMLEAVQFVSLEYIVARMSTDSLMDKRVGFRILIDSAMGTYRGFSMCVLVQ